MLKDRTEARPSPGGFFNIFFHLPTLVIIALISVVLLWQVYELNVEIGKKFIRLDSNRGSATLFWVHGCCELEW